MTDRPSNNQADLTRIVSEIEKREVSLEGHVHRLFNPVAVILKVLDVLGLAINDIVGL
jgi:hypothetical protein